MAVIAPDYAPQPHRWTRTDYERLFQEGFLGEDARVELLDGEIVDQLGQNNPHITSVRLTVAALRAAFGEGFDVNAQLPLPLGEFDVPEPDVTVLKGTSRDFDGRDPRPDEVALVVEVADSRLDTAHGRKVAIYARNGIQEYWVVNLRNRTLEVRRAPLGEQGVYAETKIVTEAGAIVPLAAFQEIRVADLLPRSAASE